MKKIVLLLLIITFSVNAQEKMLKDANKLFKNMAYTEASIKFDEYINKQSDPEAEVLRKAGDSYFYTEKPTKALPYYKSLYAKLGTNISDEYYLRYIQCLRQIRDYDEAEKHTKLYYERKGDSKLIERYMTQKRELDSINEQPSLYEIHNLEINTEYAEFGGAFYGSKLVFSSSKKNSNFEKTYAWNDQPFLNLYIADRNGSNGMLSNEKLFMPEEIPSRYHDATICFSKSLDTLYYTTNITKKQRKLINTSEGTNNFQIIRAVIKNNKVTASEPLSFNSKEYSVGHPSISNDGKWMFFTSDMEGGKGETDLYVVQLFSDGSMNSPKNLGGVINTEGREMFPYVNDSILYFASDGHYGLGGLDIFKSVITGDKDLKFSTPQNLGKPVNSNRDDFGFIIDSLETQGYLSSNRLSGKGDDDMYFFRKHEPKCDQFITGKATDSVSKLPVPEARIVAYDQFDDAVTETKTDSLGKYQLILPCGDKFSIVATKENYSEEKEMVETGKKDQDTITGVDFVMVNYKDLIEKEGDEDKISINPIYFEYDKSDITPQAAKELDKVVYAMENFPKMKIKIESHTDSRGTDSYNLKLSDERAKSTEKYIVEQRGIDQERIISVAGFGETRLLNKCSNGVKCSEEEHELNRRSNFIVVEK